MLLNQLNIENETKSPAKKKIEQKKKQKTCRSNKAKASLIGITLSMDVSREHSFACTLVYFLHMGSDEGPNDLN